MISLADIQAARARIRDSILLTPAPYSETLSRHADNTLYLKMENLHMTGSFKERGALNRILLMTDDERARGVITASAGQSRAGGGVSRVEARHSRADLHAGADAAGEGHRHARLWRGSDSARQ